MSINASSLHTRCVMNSNALFGCAITSQGLVIISDPDAAARLFICISVHVHLAKLSTAEEAIGFSPLFSLLCLFCPSLFWLGQGIYDQTWTWKQIVLPAVTDWN